MSENLFAILDMIRAEMPEISDESWCLIKRGLSRNAGGVRVYVPNQKKRHHLDVIAQAADCSDDQLSKNLGVSVRRVQQLRKLMR